MILSASVSNIVFLKVKQGKKQDAKAKTNKTLP